MTWHNICQIYEFLTTGLLSPHIFSQTELRNKLNNLSGAIIRNPIDPSETSDWTWDYKSAQHYKLLKLKLNLIGQTRQLAKNFYSLLKEASNCDYCRLFPDMKIILTDRLIEYVDEWKSRLERHFDKFKQIRLRTGFEIKNFNELGSFLRQTISSIESPSCKDLIFYLFFLNN